MVLEVEDVILVYMFWGIDSCWMFVFGRDWSDEEVVKFVMFDLFGLEFGEEVVVVKIVIGIIILGK